MISTVDGTMVCQVGIPFAGKDARNGDWNTGCHQPYERGSICSGKITWKTQLVNNLGKRILLTVGWAW